MDGCEIGMILFPFGKRKRWMHQPHVTPLHTTNTLCKVGW